MVEAGGGPDGPVEETPEAAAAVANESTVPQLAATQGPDPNTPVFQDEQTVPGDKPPTEDVIGAAMGGGTGGAGVARTGAEQPWDPEDLVTARGQDPTPERVEQARQELAEEGSAAIEKTVP